MDHIDQTVAGLRRLLGEQEAAVQGTKVTINNVLKSAGREPAFSEAELSDDRGGDITSIVGDRWYGQPLATAIRDYMTMRRASNLGPATVAEIYDALKKGGYHFEAKNDDYAKRGLRSSLTKNPTAFHRLPDGKKFGLTEWYPNARTPKGETDPASESESADNGAEGGND